MIDDYLCPVCGCDLKKRAPNVLANIKRRQVGNPLDRFVCMSCRETFKSSEVEWVGSREVWFND